MKACLLLDKVMAHFEATLSSGGYGTSQTPVSRIHPHALLHMENLYRVCLYRLVNSTRSYPDGFVSSREKLTESAVEFYDQLERTVKEDETVEVKMQALMISTFRQNKAILLSEISPTVFFNSDQLDSNHVKKLDEHIEDEAKEEKKFIPDGTHLTASRSERFGREVESRSQQISG